jgi:hypothetical protein
MKPVPDLVKFAIIPVSSVIGFVFAFDAYIVQRARTAVEPTQVKVDEIKEDVLEIKARTINIEKILMEKH